MNKLLVIIIIYLCSLTLTVHAQLVTYPAPKEAVYSMHNDDYTVRVREPGGDWQDLFEYNVKVDLDKPQDASMVYFDFSGKAEVAVRKNNGTVQSVKIRPGSDQIPAKISGNTVYFQLDRPRKISVEFNGDKLHNLHLFASAIDTHPPDPDDPAVMYFGPGIHRPQDIPGDAIQVPEGKTVYIAGGAIVRARLVCDKVSNVKITGRGILDQPLRGVEIKNCKNITVEGIIVLNPKHYTIYGGGSGQLQIRDLKSISASGWSDGIDLMSCSDVTIDDVFLRNSDDCIAIYGHRWDYYGDARNYTISNSTLWADVAHPINIGLHGNTAGEGELIENLHFKNIDILEHDEDDPDYQGCMAISNGDLNLVRHVIFEDIRIDDFQEGQLLNLRVLHHPKYNTGPGRGIEDILFKNITYTGANLSPSLISGLDSGHAIRNIRFEHLKINGKVITSAAEGNIRPGKFTAGIRFLP